MDIPEEREKCDELQGNHSLCSTEGKRGAREREDVCDTNQLGVLYLEL